MTSLAAEFEPVPELRNAPAQPGLVVMKFGGTSVAGPDDIRRAARRIVAAREGGKRVVAVLSARGQTTDELVEMAREVSERPLRPIGGFSGMSGSVLRATR